MRNRISSLVWTPGRGAFISLWENVDIILKIGGEGTGDAVWRYSELITRW
jgi:hypothetical protein